MYSIVVPVYNEGGNIAELHSRLLVVCNALGNNFELIYIDDGSTDDTASILDHLSPATIIRFRKNFGQTAALDAGIKHARGEYIITLDSDLQNPPEEIPKLIEAMKTQAVDVISGWRKKRKDSQSKHIVSRGANMLRKMFINDGIHDSGCTLKMYRRECFANIDLFGETHRFIPGILRWQGFSIGEIEVEHHERTSGTSKYTYKRILKGFVDMIGIWFWRKYSDRPLHLFGGTGILFSALGFVMLFFLAIARIFFAYSLSNSIWPLIAILFILVGIQLFISGLLADILIKNYYQSGRTPYTIKSIDKQ